MTQHSPKHRNASNHKQLSALPNHRLKRGWAAALLINELMNAPPLFHKLTRVPNFPRPRKCDTGGDKPSRCQPPATQGCARMGASTQHRAPSEPHAATALKVKKPPTQNHSNLRGCLPLFTFNRSPESPSSKAAKFFPWHAGFLAKKKKKKK